MSNLQVLGRRCPIMGKALAVQSVRNNALTGSFGGARAYSSAARVHRAKLHTSASKEAQAVEIDRMHGKQSMSPLPSHRNQDHGCQSLGTNI